MAGRAPRQVARGVAGRARSGEEWSRAKWQVARRETDRARRGRSHVDAGRATKEEVKAINGERRADRHRARRGRSR